MNDIEDVHIVHERYLFIQTSSAIRVYRFSKVTIKLEYEFLYTYPELLYYKFEPSLENPSEF